MAEPRIVSIEAEAITVGGTSGAGDSLRVTVVGAGEVPPIAGETTAKGDVSRFEPAFPFSPRAEYEIVLGAWSERFKLAAETDLGALAEVVAIYPSGDLLPQNQLKFYLHFSRPMSRGEAYQHIRLLDAEGKVIADPFLELAEELWDADGKRLTVFLDPGRVKRGLKPHLEAGPPLLAGKSYRLEISADWKDAERRPMSNPFTKLFRTTAPDYRQPDPERWALALPAAGTRDALVVSFETALDRGLLGRLLAVHEKGSKAALAGAVENIDHETRWAFTPAAPWRAGDFRLVVGSELEDLAGNSIRKPFEVTAENPGRDFVGPTVSRRFSIAALE